MSAPLTAADAERVILRTFAELAGVGHRKGAAMQTTELLTENGRPSRAECNIQVAIRQGRITPEQAESWRDLYERDGYEPTTKALVALRLRPAKREAYKRAAKEIVANKQETREPVTRIAIRVGKDEVYIRRRGGGTRCPLSGAEPVERDLRAVGGWTFGRGGPPRPRASLVPPPTRRSVMLLLFALVSWVGSTYAAHALGTRKGRRNCWLWGFLVGWVGVVVVACLGPRYEKRNKRAPGEDQRWAELVRQAELDRQRAR